MCRKYFPGCTRTPLGGHVVGQRPLLDHAAEQVNNGEQVHKPVFHPDVRNVGGPSLVGLFNSLPQCLFMCEMRRKNLEGLLQIEKVKIFTLAFSSRWFSIISNQQKTTSDRYS